MVLSEVSGAVVIGAGISGLTTAVTLAETGRPVRIITEHPPERTNSAMAGASWGLYMASDDRAVRWSGETFARLAEIAGGSGTGVRMIAGTEAFERRVVVPRWAREVPDFRRCGLDELPAGYVDGWRYTVPIVDMTAYLRYLRRRFTRLGGTVRTGVSVSSFGRVAAEAAADAGGPVIVVNCTGLGSRTLVPDASLAPTRGQLVVVDNPGVAEFFQDNPADEHAEDLTYILPHERYVILGGRATVPDDATAAVPARPDPGAAAAIVERCAGIAPVLRRARILGHRVGLRPTRPSVRVEWDERTDISLVHNYGHGGSGVTLSWGCAFEVRDLIAERMKEGAAGTVR